MEVDNEVKERIEKSNFIFYYFNSIHYEYTNITIGDNFIYYYNKNDNKYHFKEDNKLADDVKKYICGKIYKIKIYSKISMIKAYHRRKYASGVINSFTVKIDGKGYNINTYYLPKFSKKIISDVREIIKI